ncbi:MAG TPA: MarR family transcriptional regulator [Tepidisphaeraceae bacterium]|jgi:DNA-binding MarR family transcriptional regulator|nr:MarR family transcriptional regulator [Tepidisphaeraceae bacterium]
MFYLRDLPRYEALRERVNRYSGGDARGMEAFLVLMRVASDILGGIEAWLARHGMSQGKFTLIMILNRDPKVGMLPSELAERSGVTRATITGLLDGLERERFISRENHAHDRRKAIVRLTKEGQALIDGIVPGYYDLLGNLMEDLSEGEKRELIELLVKLNRKLPGLWGAAGKTREFPLPEDPESQRKNEKSE